MDRRCGTYLVLHVVGTKADIPSGTLSQTHVPLQVLGTVNVSPVPVSVKHSTNEILVVDLGNLGTVDRVTSNET